MQLSLPRSWRVWLPVSALLVGCLLLFLFWPNGAPGTRWSAESSPNHRLAGSSAARASWKEGGALRVGSPEPVRQASVISPYGPGFEFELVANFCEVVSCTPHWVNVPDKDTGFAMLRRGEIDVLVGFWGDGPEKRAEPAAETAAPTGEALPALAVGKAYAHFNPVRISGAAVPGAADAADGSAAAPRDDGTYSLSALSRAFTALMPAIVEKNGSGEHAGAQPFPVFSLGQDGKGAEREDILLLDPASYALWLPFLGDVNTKHAKRQTPYRWFWRDDDGALALRFSLFWDSPERAEEVAELTERYFGFLPRNLRQRDILDLSETLASRLPVYEKYIMNAAKETGVPPLLLVAAIYQESRFDPDAVSETRVRGIMQLTTATAEMLNVDRKDPEQCIMGGARYLRDLWERVSDKADDDWDRWFMALAAYNQGMSNLNRTIKLAQQLGKKGDTWADLKQVFPLSTTCRGKEAKSFVERIRYYNFILHGLVALAPAETQDFAPLLGLALADSAL